MEALSWSSSGTFELMLLLMLIYSMINHYKFQFVQLIILYAVGWKRKREYVTGSVYILILNSMMHVTFVE